MSIALAWCDFKTYGEDIGPGRTEPPRPAQCVFCDGIRVWFNGWRRVFPTLLVDGRPHRPPDGIALRRVRCGRRECRRSWTLRPPWLYPQRSLEPDMAEAAALAYLLEPATSYAAVDTTAFGCAWITVWRWVGWLAALATPAMLLAHAARLAAPGGPSPGCSRATCPPPLAPARRRGRGPSSRPRRSSSPSPSCIVRSRSRRPIPVRFAGGCSPSSSRSGAWRF